MRGTYLQWQPAWPWTFGGAQKFNKTKIISILQQFFMARAGAPGVSASALPEFPPGEFSIPHVDGSSQSLPRKSLIDPVLHSRKTKMIKQ